MKKTPRLTPLEEICLALVVVVSLLSIAKTPSLPLNDSALYEWYGWGILHGHHLYADLPEVKLPSLYYTNALYQLLFGSNYFLHTCAEALLNLATIALFALILRRLRVEAWAVGTLLFAIVYTLPIAQFNYPEFYAIPLFLLCMYLSLRGQNLAAGCAMALATTYWIPSPIMLVPLLLRRVEARQRWSLLLGFVGTFVIFAIAFIPILGTRWILVPLSLWPAFLHVTFPGVDLTFLRNQLSATLLRAGLVPLTLLLLAVFRRPQNEAQRFGLQWSGVAFIAAVVPPRFFEWYFWPLLTALTMTIAAYLPLSRERFARQPEGLLRGAALFVCAGFIVNAVVMDYADMSYVKTYADDVVKVGGIVRGTVGAGWVLWTPQYIPEAYLVTEAIEPDIGASVTGHFFVNSWNGGGLVVAPDAWLKVPEMVVDGGPFHPALNAQWLRVLDPGDRITRLYVAICSEKTGGLRLYALPQLCPVLASQTPGCSCPPA